MTLHRIPVMSPDEAGALLNRLGYRHTMSTDEVKAIAEPLNEFERASFVKALRVTANAAFREAEQLRNFVATRSNGGEA